MEITPRLSAMIARKSPTDVLRDAAVEEGMLTLKQSVKRLVLDGTTTITEMQRISVEDLGLLGDERQAGET